MKITDLQNYEVIAGDGTGIPQSQAEKPAKTGDFSTGLGKSILKTIKGVGQFAGKVDKTLSKAVGTQPGPDYFNEENLQQSKEQGKGFGKLFNEENLEYGEGEKLGGFTGDVATLAIPGTKAARLTKGANALTKIATRAGTSAGVTGLQQGGFGKDAITAGAVEIAVPAAGKLVKPVYKLTSRLLQGIGSGLSGAPVSQLKQVAKDPSLAKEFAKRESGDIMREDATTVLQGVSKVRQEARKAFGEGLDQLEQIDIQKPKLKEAIMKTMKKYKVSSSNGEIKLGKVDFESPKLMAKAQELVTKLNKQKDLSGKGLRKLMDDIESEKFGVATSDERMSFNKFVDDISGSIKEGITSSTPKLDEINKSFSQDMQLATAVERIFGKVKFKNQAELDRVSEKLEGIFNKKGITPERIDEFLTRIGKSPEEFRTGQAVRQIGDVTQQSNSVGLNPIEVIRSFTSAVVTPKAVRDIAIFTGLAEQTVKELSEKLSPTARATLIKLLTEGTNEPDSQ